MGWKPGVLLLMFRLMALILYLAANVDAKSTTTAGTVMTSGTLSSSTTTGPIKNPVNSSVLVAWDARLSKNFQLGVCYLEAIQGPCLDLYPLWYFNQNELQCQQFFFGGCLGNDNRFANPTTCQTYCNPDCTAKMDVGTSAAFGFPSRNGSRWYYDMTSAGCMPFFYLGYGGSKNNFASKLLCDSFCSSQTCNITVMDPGTGNVPTVRWFYNATSDLCVNFTWKGLGNLNNFPSESLCLRQCQQARLACPYYECYKECPYGFVTNNLGCAMCQCVDPCMNGTKCTPPAGCIVQTASCNYSTCVLLTTPYGRCYSPCDKNKVFTLCSRVDPACDPTCPAGSFIWCSQFPGCVARCVCPPDKPLLHATLGCLSYQDCKDLNSSMPGQLLDSPDLQVHRIISPFDVSVIFFCDFEDDIVPMCGMHEEDIENGEFEIWDGASPNPNTGPQGTQKSQGRYLLFNSKKTPVGGEAHIFTPALFMYGDFAKCFSFNYLMYGISVGSLTVQGITNGYPTTVWQQSKDGFIGIWKWQTAKISLPPEVTYVKIIATRGGSKPVDMYGDIAIDNVDVRKGACGSVVSSYINVTRVVRQKNPVQTSTPAYSHSAVYRASVTGYCVAYLLIQVLWKV